MGASGLTKKPPLIKACSRGANLQRHARGAGLREEGQERILPVHREHLRSWRHPKDSPACSLRDLLGARSGDGARLTTSLLCSRCSLAPAAVRSDVWDTPWDHEGSVSTSSCASRAGTSACRLPELNMASFRQESPVLSPCVIPGLSQGEAQAALTAQRGKTRTQSSHGEGPCNRTAAER